MISNDDASSLSPDEQRKLFEDRGIIFTESNDKNNDKIQEIGYYKLKEFAMLLLIIQMMNQNLKLNIII